MKFKKVICSVLIVITMIMVLCGCAKISIEESEYYNSCYNIVGNFVDVASGKTESFNYTIYADKETGVMYLYTWSGGSATMCVVYNSDGTPMLYNFGDR